MAEQTSRIRYGVIGTGMMGVEHIQNVMAIDGAVVTAVSDPHPASIEWARARGRAERRSDDVRRPQRTARFRVWSMRW